LRKGTYKIWVYTDCITCPDDIEAMSQTIVVKENKEEITLPDFIIRL
jgi:hypothetical protein